MDANDNLPLMTWHARPDMSCEYVNDAWLRFTGYTLERALGDGWYRCLHPDDLARWLDAGVRAFDERRAFDIEYRLRRRDGVYRWILDRAEPRYGAGGEFLGFGGACIELDPGNAALAGLRVLVVGYDRETYGELMRELVRPLESAGADVRVAAGDSEALRTLDAWQPDVLLAEKHVIRALRGLPEQALLEAVARLAA